MYPKKKYAPTGGHVIAEDEHHEKSLGPGWTDIPQPLQPTPAEDAKRKAEADKAEADAKAHQDAEIKRDTQAKRLAEAQKVANKKAADTPNKK